MKYTYFIITIVLFSISCQNDNIQEIQQQKERQKIAADSTNKAINDAVQNGIEQQKIKEQQAEEQAYQEIQNKQFRQDSIQIEDERNNVASFIIQETTYTTNFLGTEYNLNILLKNTAEFTEYKNIELEVIYYDSSEQEITRESFIVYEYLNLESTKYVKKKVPIYQGTSTIGLVVKSAQIK